MECRDTVASDASALAALVATTFADLQKRTGFAEDLADLSLCELEMTDLVVNGVCVVEKSTNRYAACNFLSTLEPGCEAIRAIGPVTVHPDFQGHGLGKKIMKMVIEKAEKEGAQSLRLAVDTHNPVSFSLYCGFGFQIREVIKVLGPRDMPSSPVVIPVSDTIYIRPMRSEDLHNVCSLMQRVCGFQRPNEIGSALRVGKDLKLGRTGVPMVAVSKSSSSDIVGFMTGIFAAAFSGAVSEDVWRCMFAAAWNYANGHDDPNLVWPEGDSRKTSQNPCDPNLSIIMVPAIRHPDLLLWLLQNGLRVVKGMYAMERGDLMTAFKPDGVWFQSVEC